MKYTDYRVFKTAIGGKLLELEIGKVCELANGQVMVRYGDTVVNVTACASKEPRPDIDFFPLSCDYEEKMYAAGKIPGGFIKREGRPSEKAILNSRLMDRPLRPLFPKGFYNDVQVVATVMCVDHDAPSEIAAMIGSSVALAISDIPWEGPTGSVLIGMVDGQFVVNPSLAQREESCMHLVVSGTKDAIMMVEAGANEVPEEVILDAIMFAHEEIKKIVEFIEMIVAEIGKPKMEIELYKVPEDIDAAVRAYAEDKMREAILTYDKMERLDNMDAVEAEAKEHFAEIYPDNGKDIGNVLYAITKEQVRKMILDDGIRPDNRKRDEIRPIWCDTGILPRTHGTGLFKRGQTQVLSVATLGPLGEAQTIDGITEQTEKRYMHHYNFPPYSVGEAGRMKSPGRREIGHGALAERALLPVLPSEEEFPYAIRVVSEVLSSNGSTSMGSTCGSCLALMDAGVPIKAPVAGIAMGLIERVEEDGTSKMAILSDIQGMEDFLGDMDFKVAGTAKGVTAIQMDIKVHGLSKQVLQDALKQAYEGRMHIMGEMLDEIAEPRAELSPYAPRIISMQVDPDHIRTIIGPGGKTINRIIADTGVKIDIDDTGLVYIAAPDMESAQAGVREIELLIKEPEPGEIYEGKVTRILTTAKGSVGAFIEILPGKEGLLHISKMAKERVEKVEDVMNVGDVVKVKVTEIDSQNRINLSRKELL
ncbi:MAG: polyribonucleotide nucleotidyltransferase [Bacillota bacterium]|nr:polyribonucleotide nucleotidyltransferase [Bacillota bacterium]MBR3787465.1 polyribonucleotide nucleotidyltransferase [Bacillota bacterium]MBR6798912.1 polyribonucleotide nucleotidyltransferase [Bacillota bacterium]MDO5414273.1 polyribonucleotide nucleotidyltransferase [Bacillota bacterium]